VQPTPHEHRHRGDEKRDREHADEPAGNEAEQRVRDPDVAEVDGVQQPGSEHDDERDVERQKHRQRPHMERGEPLRDLEDAVLNEQREREDDPADERLTDVSARVLADAVAARNPLEHLLGSLDLAQLVVARDGLLEAL